MESLIIEKPAMILAGLSTKVTLNDVLSNKTTLKVASNFLERRAEIKNCINEREVFGLSTDPEDYNPETDQFEYFIGIEVSANDGIPDGMDYREIPANTYVLFTFKGPFENAGAVHNYLYSTWLKQSGYELSGLFNIEIYDERNHGPESEESLTDICFPVRKK
ncbi:GyrI-like domain-containing protein [Paenibacillus alginolyticus]|uniref:GyrI-like domain-containing protein n=1 Tax=Paenibacillus alginolyticus TaxID=59839 RepID=UPI000423E722|nr:GyrI-like domain-containing protein [Paenibacillus alginolyticus]MCY9667989.1 GyrI-like domain-containing protein [Paenibacillus alginolyticus]